MYKLGIPQMQQSLLGHFINNLMPINDKKQCEIAMIISYSFGL